MIFLDIYFKLYMTFMPPCISCFFCNCVTIPVANGNLIAKSLPPILKKEVEGKGQGVNDLIDPS